MLSRSERIRTLILVNAASIMESADASLLPAVYKEVGSAMGATPTALGALTLYRSVVQVLFYPLAAYAAARHNRAAVVAAGAFLWSLSTFLVALSTTYSAVAVSRGLSGVGLALIIPAVKSLVADCTDESTRGMAFGWLHLSGSVGGIVGSFLALLLAPTEILGVAGWRAAFHLVAAASVAVGAMVWIFAVDPHFPKPAPASGKEAASALLRDARAVVGVPSFQVIIAQGVFGSFPGHALAFAPMWLELAGFTHADTALIITAYAVATAVGGLLGGALGDQLSQRLPDAGRVVLAQISSSSRIPFAALLLIVLPDDPSTGVAHGAAFFFLGLIGSWCGPATNNPIFAEIVPEKSRTSIYALDKSFESALAAFAPPAVGYIAEHIYGYRSSSTAKGAGAGSLRIDRENASSLAKALFACIAVPMAICCAIYSLLYCTYPRDRRRCHGDASGGDAELTARRSSEEEESGKAEEEQVLLL